MTKIKLTNAVDFEKASEGLIERSKVRSVEVADALVDTGASTLVLPPSVADPLGLPVLERLSVLLANGQRQEVPTVGPIRLEILGRTMSIDAVVIPGAERVLIGLIPLQHFCLVVDPASHELRFDPKNPEGVLDVLAVA